MITRLRGPIIESEPGRIVVDCNGVGYEVHVPESIRTEVEAQPTANIYTRQIFREDDQNLYGFTSRDQRDLFDLLRSVKGCGAKIALAILDTVGVNSTISAIATGQQTTLSKTSGVGPRLAERICVELRDKAAKILPANAVISHQNSTQSTHQDQDLIDALIALGYRLPEAELAATKIEDPTVPLQERIKISLKHLAK